MMRFVCVLILSSEPTTHRTSGCSRALSLLTFVDSQAICGREFFPVDEATLYLTFFRGINNDQFAVVQYQIFHSCATLA